MKYLKLFEDYKIKSEFGGGTIYPDFFTEGGELFDYFNLIGTQDIFDFPHSDTDYWEKVTKINKDRKKRRKQKKKEILSYINDFIKLPENQNFCYGMINFPVMDFNMVFDFNSVKNENDWKPYRKLKTIELKTIMGTYKLNQTDFEDLVRYTSDPELYLNAKKYNL